MSLCREAKKIPMSETAKKLKIALMADFSSQQLTLVLKTLFHKSNITADILEAEFDSMDHMILAQDSPLEVFAPDVVVLLESTQALRNRYHSFKGTAHEFAAEKAQELEMRWHKIRQKCPKAVILQTNYVLPYERPFGNYGNRVPDTFLSAVQSINESIAKSSLSGFNIFRLDMDTIASYVGKKVWFDERLWSLYKYPCSLEFLPLIAQSIVDVALALRGCAIKCVIVDLDNTLWGGIVGDDGVDGIQLGHGEEGEAFLLFQAFLLDLKKRGVLLAVCSKNDPENARAPFMSRSEMILKLDDFAVFVANWEDKPGNIRMIQETLNIGFDSLLFLDDSAFERNFVRQTLPEVVVPEMPEDPAEFVKFLTELNLFEVASHSEADGSRTQMYQEEFQRTQLKTNFQDHDDYLRSLDIKIQLERCSSRQLSRMAQLLQRSNQFNLATRRFTEAQCEAFMSDEAGALPLCVTLQDKFGDYGMISCVVVTWGKDEAVIEEWAMSCRVLFRGVEQCIMNHIVEQAKQRGLRRLVGRYILTDKNKMVKNFYKEFGFEQSGDVAGDGSQRWTLDVSLYQPKKVWMEDISLTQKA